MGQVDMSVMPSPTIVLPAILLSSILFSPFINGLFGFGEEFGWRGYLLQKLLPLGKPKAYILLGIIWGLWHLPLVVIGFTYPGRPILGILLIIIMATAFGIYLNELTLHYQSSILAGWAHGLFNSQKLGLWAILFPTMNPIIGGYSGIIGLIVWMTIGLVQLWFINKTGRANKSLELTA